MAQYLKKAVKDGHTLPQHVTHTVQELLADIRSRGEVAVKELARKFDGWTKDFIVSGQEIEALISQVPQSVKEDWSSSTVSVSN